MSRFAAAAIVLLALLVGDGVAAEREDDVAPPSLEQTIAQRDSRSAVERYDAVEALAAIPSERATEGLIHALDDRSPRVAQAAVDALGQRTQERASRRRAVEGLVHALDARAPRVPRAAVKSLADIDTMRSTEGLVHALDSDDATVARVAVEALAARARRASDERATEGLIHALDGDDVEIRRIAAAGLRAAGGERAREGLHKAQGDPDERVRGIAGGSAD